MVGFYISFTVAIELKMSLINSKRLITTVFEGNYKYTLNGTFNCIMLFPCLIENKILRVVQRGRRRYFFGFINVDDSSSYSSESCGSMAITFLKLPNSTPRW